MSLSIYSVSDGRLNDLGCISIHALEDTRHKAIGSLRELTSRGTREEPEAWRITNHRRKIAKAKIRIAIYQGALISVWILYSYVWMFGECKPFHIFRGGRIVQIWLTHLWESQVVPTIQHTGQVGRDQHRWLKHFVMIRPALLGLDFWSIKLSKLSLFYAAMLSSLQACLHFPPWTHKAWMTGACVSVGDGSQMGGTHRKMKTYKCLQAHVCHLHITCFGC